MPDYGTVNLNWLGNLGSDYYQGAQQGQTLSQQQAFRNGIPMTPDGQPDFKAIMQILAQKGDVNAISELSGPEMQQQQQQRDAALFKGFIPQGGAPINTGQPLAPAAAAPGAPMAPQAAPQAPPGSLAPAGGGNAPTVGAPPASAAAAIPTGLGGGIGQPSAASGTETVSALASAALQGSPQSTTVAENVARALRVQPDQPLTPDQQARAERYIKAYAARRGVAASDGNEPRGIRNNNPDNIEDTAFTENQPGYAGPEPQGRYATFDSPAEGLNAASNLLGSYARQGINTIQGIISKWAPSSDGNNVTNYANFVAQKLGIRPDQPLDMQNPQVRQQIAGAMAQFENGPGAARALPGAPQGTPAPGGQGGALIPQVPLPNGITDPQQAILAIDNKIAQISNPQMLDALRDWRERIAAQIKPIEVGPSTTYVNPVTGQVVYRGAFANPGGTLSENALDAAAETYYQTGKMPTNIGRGIQGASTMNTIMNRATELHPDVDWSTRPRAWQEFGAQSSGGRVLAQRRANLDLAGQEASSLLPRVLEASKAVPRTDYPSLNKIIEVARSGTGDPNVIRFGIAAESLIRVYARVLQPTGKPTVTDTQNARDLLDKAWSQGQIEGAIKQFKIELDAAESSLAKAEKKYYGGEGGDEAGTADTGQSASPAQSQGGSMPTIQTQDEYDKLKPGDQYKRSDGSVWTKK